MLKALDIVEHEDLARAVRERADRALEIEHRGSEIARTVTMSFGVAGCVPDAQVVADTLVERADRALYAAKRAGRNAVLGFSELPPAEEAPTVDLDVGDATGTPPGFILH